MPGTLASDKLAAELYDGTAITSKTTTTGSAVRVDWPLDCEVEMTFGTMSGSSGTMDVEIQASDASNFGTFVSLGRFAQETEAATGTKVLSVYCAKKYMRAVIVTGGSTVTSFTPTVVVRPCNYQRTPDTTA